MTRPTEAGQIAVDLIDAANNLSVHWPHKGLARWLLRIFVFSGAERTRFETAILDWRDLDSDARRRVLDALSGENDTRRQAGTGPDRP